MERRYRKIPQDDCTLLSQEVDGELVMYHCDEDVVHRLNPSGKLVWDSFDQPRTRAELAGLVAGAYGLPVDEVRDDVDEMVDDLLEDGLIRETERPGSGEDERLSTRRAFLGKGLKGAAAAAYAVPLIQTFGLSKAHAQPPSVITNDPPPPTADPVITSIVPTSQQINTKRNIRKTVKVYGYDFVQTPTADFGADIIIRNVVYKNPNWVNVKIRIPKTSTPGARTVRITNPNGSYDDYCCYTLT